MIIHYLKVAIRNILKYKVQNVVNVCAIAVSLTLLAIGASLLSRVGPLAIFSQPHADRTVLIRCVGDGARYFTLEEYDAMDSHQFLSTGKLYPRYAGGMLLMVTAYKGEADASSMIAVSDEVKDDYLRIMGYESILHSGLCNDLPADGVVLTKPLAEKLFGNRPPAGAKVSVKYLSWIGDGSEENKTKDFFVVDVIDPVDNLTTRYGLFLPIQEERGNAGYGEIMAVLNEGMTPDDLKKELTALLPDKESRVTTFKDHFGADNEEIQLVAACILMFLLAFVLVSVVNYLRQQIQLAKARQREIALRTSLGAKAGSLYITFCLDIIIILTAALLLSLLLSTSLETIAMGEYETVFGYYWFFFDKMYRITFEAFAGILIISLAAMILAVRHIKRNRQGLALQMRPMPKHRLRNVGITFQLTISMVLMWMAVVAGMSRNDLREYFGIPADDQLINRCFQVNFNSNILEERDLQTEFMDKARRLESVEKVVPMERSRMVLNVGQEVDGVIRDYIGATMYSQHDSDVTDFYGVDVDVLNPDADPDRNIVVSESFRKALEEKGRWDGLTVEKWGEVYEVYGTYGKLPFSRGDEADAIITDNTLDDAWLREKVIVSKPGREDETRAALEKIIHEMFPSRIDIKVVKFFNNMASEYIAINGMIFLLLVISVISVVTTVAGIYAGVALDTRRRRKEMALRKINGARTGDIRALFSRSYVVIFSISVLLSFALCLTISTQDVIPPYIGHKWIAYAIAVLIMAVIVVLTLAWRIRDVMRVDPAEYLKE